MKSDRSPDQVHARFRGFAARRLSLFIFCSGLPLSLGLALWLAPHHRSVWALFHQIASGLLLGILLLWTLALWGFVSRLRKALLSRIERGAPFPSLYQAASDLGREIFWHGAVLILGLAALGLVSLTIGPLQHLAVAVLFWGCAAMVPLIVRYHWGLKLVRRRLTPRPAR
ncbi:MAG TPA: hypothetical protein VNN09_05095 [Candidatus Competibacteraceae bacterium]|nr:hypothetical protein [Candidatus Competibacteraceae bacterium]